MNDKQKVGIQGIKAAFHDLAARKYFTGSDLSLFEFGSFEKLAISLKQGKIDYAIMAIENSIAGSLLPNYSLIGKYQLKIVGEIYQRIELHLMALPGTKIDDLRYVMSHPMALMQSREFLDNYPLIEAVEIKDTAESAFTIAEKNLLQYGAIASELAATQYGLEILARNIESYKKNYTRFLILANHQVPSIKADKSSISFVLPDQPGSLAKILSRLAAHSINLTKIQSIPIPGEPNQYSFLTDLVWDNYDTYLEVMKQLSSEYQVKVFGEYIKAKIPYHEN